jgi:uncharacterized protein YkwD
MNMEMNPKVKRWIIVIGAVALLSASAIAGYIYRDQIKDLFGKSTNPEQKIIWPKSDNRSKDLKADQIIYWTNYYRAQNGLKALTTNTTLAKAAQGKVDDMFKNQYFEHVSPAGVTPSELVSSFGYSYKVTGENLALGDFVNEKELVDAWMSSPGHRANILNKDYTEIGVASGLGKYQDRELTWLSVQEFGKPLPNCNKPNESTLNSINSKKAELESLNKQIASLSQNASSLMDRGNAKIAQGNEIYNSTHDSAQAQPYWDEGASLQNQAKAASAQAQTLQSQASSLSSELNSISSQYNSQVDIYNACMEK